MTFDIIEENNEYMVFIQTPFRKIDRCTVSYDAVTNQVIIQGCASSLVDTYYKIVMPQSNYAYKIVELQNPRGSHKQTIDLPNYIRDIDIGQLRSHIFPNAVVVSMPKLNTPQIDVAGHCHAQ